MLQKCIFALSFCPPLPKLYALKPLIFSSFTSSRHSSVPGFLVLPPLPQALLQYFGLPRFQELAPSVDELTDSLRFYPLKIVLL